MIIALTGPAGSGKDAIGKILVKNHGFTRFYFAEPLKKMTETLLRSSGLEDEDLINRYVHGDLKEEPCPWLNSKTPRHAMQTIGTEWGRKCMGDDFWVKSLTNKIVPNKDYVITDCRFDNEWTALRDIGGYLWRREGNSTAAGSHASEAGISAKYGGLTFGHTETLKDLSYDVADAVAAIDAVEMAIS